MKKFFRNHLGVVLASIGFTCLFNSGLGQSSSGQILNLVWAEPTPSVPVGKSASQVDENLSFTIVLKDPDGTDSFGLLLTDDNEKMVNSIGEYYVKKHENGFFYVEEKNTGELKTVLNNVVHFLVPVKYEKVKKTRALILKVMSKKSDNSQLGTGEIVNVEVPKLKKK